MPLMVGNIVVLNSGSPPMTVKAITHGYRRARRRCCTHLVSSYGPPPKL